MPQVTLSVFGDPLTVACTLQVPVLVKRTLGGVPVNPLPGLIDHTTVAPLAGDGERLNVQSDPLLPLPHDCAIVPVYGAVVVVVGAAVVVVVDDVVVVEAAVVEVVLAVVDTGMVLPVVVVLAIAPEGPGSAMADF
jgi:hypothetical protein